MAQQTIQESTAHLLAQVCKCFRRYVHRQLEGLGLYRGQHFVLLSLWHEEGLSHSELARDLSVSPATISNALKRMEKAGFVQRRPDPSDERVSRVYLTEAGRDVRSAVEETWKELEERAFAGFGREEQATLHGLLGQVLANLQEGTLEDKESE